MADMSTYLSAVAADYTATELTLAPHKIMKEKGQKAQHIHHNDDGSIEVVTRSGSYFDITIQWGWLSDPDADALKAFWEDDLKSNGFGRSFYWYHPADENTYTARFMADLTLVYEAEKAVGQSVPPLQLRIEGNKP